MHPDTQRSVRAGTTAGQLVPTCFTLLFFVAAFGCSGCTRRSVTIDRTADVKLEIVELQPDPPVQGAAVLVLRLSDAEGRPVTGASVSLKADMTHAGMAPVLDDAEEVGEGLYRMSFEWTMAGDWVLTVSGTLEDGRGFEHVLLVSVVGQGG